MKLVPPADAIARKFPESVVFIVAPDPDGGDPNVMPAGWSMFTSNEPLLLAVSVGLERFTHDCLQQAEEFAVAFPSAAQREDIVFCGSHSGADVDKLAATDLELTEPASISMPILEDAAACFECVPDGTLLTGDHRIFVGEIVAAHVSETYEEKVTNLGHGWSDGPDRFKTLSELLESSATTP